MLLYEHAVWQYRKEQKLQTSESVFEIRDDDQTVSRNQVQKEHVVDSFATERQPVIPNECSSKKDFEKYAVMKINSP